MLESFNNLHKLLFEFSAFFNRPLPIAVRMQVKRRKFRADLSILKVLSDTIPQDVKVLISTHFNAIEIFSIFRNN